jgi:hypothetical protein
MAKLSICIALTPLHIHHCGMEFNGAQKQIHLFNFTLHIPLQLSHQQESSVYKEHVKATGIGANNRMNLSSMTQLHFMTIT